VKENENPVLAAIGGKHLEEKIARATRRLKVQSSKVRDRSRALAKTSPERTNRPMNRGQRPGWNRRGLDVLLATVRTAGGI